MESLNRDSLVTLLNQIKPVDLQEKEHITDTIKWIRSGVEIYRIQKPDIPPKHLVSYSVLVDLESQKVFLLDHIKSGLLLPNGGHVDKGEDPSQAARRELYEEMSLDVDFVGSNPKPFFLTQATTVGSTAGHSDVSLWYIFKADSKVAFKKFGEHFEEEFNGGQWYDFDEVLTMPIEKLDIHMHRFINKLKGKTNEV